jgi:hypothetical protein
MTPLASRGSAPIIAVAVGVCVAMCGKTPYLRPYRDEPSASRPIRADKHRRGQRVLTWVTSREHCAAAGIFFANLNCELSFCYWRLTDYTDYVFLHIQVA